MITVVESLKHAIAGTGMLSARGAGSMKQHYPEESCESKQTDSSGSMVSHCTSTFRESSDVKRTAEDLLYVLVVSLAYLTQKVHVIPCRTLSGWVICNPVTLICNSGDCSVFFLFCLELA